MKRTIGKLVRLTAKEQQRLRNHAKKCGLSEEAYLRFLLNGHAPKEVPPLEYHRLIRELNAIGNNLHQIAARANATGFFLKEDYALGKEIWRRNGNRATGLIQAGRSGNCKA